MATKEEIQAEIAKLDAKIGSGVRDVTVGTVRTTVDLKVMQDERTRLRRKLAAMNRRCGSDLSRPIYGLGDF